MNCPNEFLVTGNAPVLRPVQSVAGSLAAYGRARENFQEIRKRVWKMAADEAAGDPS